eukprot:2879817-Rhodomonas_salina.2
MLLCACDATPVLTCTPAYAVQIVLLACYALSGTEPAYGATRATCSTNQTSLSPRQGRPYARATRCPVLVHACCLLSACAVLNSCMQLGACRAACGTKTACGCPNPKPMRCAVLRSSMQAVRYRPTAPYAMSGTDIAYGGIVIRARY